MTDQEFLLKLLNVDWIEIGILIAILCYNSTSCVEMIRAIGDQFVKIIAAWRNK